MIEVLLAAPGLAQEPELVVAAPAAGLRVVRRCVDVADLLAAAAADAGAVVVVSSGLPRLSPDAVERLSVGRRLIGLAEGAESAERLHGLGVHPVLAVGASASATIGAIRDAALDGGGSDAGVWDTGCWDADRRENPDAPWGATAPTSTPAGQVVAVWGPMGAPGRTTIAMGISEALAAEGRRVCLVDADTYAPSITLALGIVEEASGIVVACRHADNGSLAASTLTVIAPRVRERWHVMGGLPTPDRWPDLRSGALERVWSACRDQFDVTVIDVGFCLEEDEGGTWARRRNAAALTAIAAADLVVAVADASAAGAARLAAVWPTMPAVASGTPMVVVRNRARDGGRPWAQALRACGVHAPVHAIPSDPRALSACWERGRSLGEGARRSRVRRALGELALLAVSR